MLERYLAHALPDPAQGTLWYLSVPFTQGMVYNVYAERIAATFFKTSFRPRPADGRNSYFPEMTDLDGLSITFYETFDYRVTNWLETWRKLIRDADGNYGPPAVFKKTMTLRIYARDNLRSPIITINYEGCAPSDKTPFELGYDDETLRITVEAQFSVDNMEIIQGDIG